MTLEVELLGISGLRRIQPARREDSRGSFMRLFCEEELASVLQGRRIVQINRSASAATGSIRGLHYQRAPHAEMKFVTCLRGQAWDVAIDLRAGSGTFLNWHAETLDAGIGNMLAIPEGFAHGFQTLQPDTELLYLHTAAYAPNFEGAVRFDDPRVGISWPLPASAISARDLGHALLARDFMGLDQ